ncbi:MAG: hypothetical protein U5O16_19815 [Rhodococcus sp. (in: high G+C Gram-positive bacteria)]|uniref:hypothetical protein n=1 Tax=Rhodococcus sp. TaxID=1831 RepID=UPI002ADC41CB|nr:hypothetical protein [Rhodococcus sp. (in: high G+C Gram-positive bacteria)]
MTAQTFHVEGLDGITFTPTYDPARKWLVIEGHDRDGDLVSRSAFSVTPDPIPDVAITPEPETGAGAVPADLLSAAVAHTEPSEGED